MSNIDVFGPANATNAVTARPFDGRQFTSTDTWFKDCSSPTAQDGTDILAAWLNELVANNRSIARANGLKLDGVNPVVAQDNGDDLLLRGIEALIQRNQILFARNTGTGDAAVIPLSPVPAELVDGMEMLTYYGSPNTTTAPVANVGTGAKSVLKAGGAAPAIGDLSGFVRLRWDAQANALKIGGLSPSDAGAYGAFRNLVLNPRFTQNKRNKSGTITLAPGAYGHDMWKAGVSGCTYTVSGGVVTISAGSLKQVIEDPAVNTGVVALGPCAFAQAGNAQCSINGGAFATGSQSLSHMGGAITLEFQSGTISVPQFEASALPTPFAPRSEPIESLLCRRWVRTSFGPGVTPAVGGLTGFSSSGQGTGIVFPPNSYTSAIYSGAIERFDTPMAATPTVTTYNPNSTSSGSYPSNAADCVNGAGSGNVGLTVWASRSGIFFETAAYSGVQNQLGVHYFATCEP